MLVSSFSTTIESNTSTPVTVLDICGILATMKMINLTSVVLEGYSSWMVRF